MVEIISENTKEDRMLSPPDRIKSIVRVSERELVNVFIAYQENYAAGFQFIPENANFFLTARLRLESGRDI